MNGQYDFKILVNRMKTRRMICLILKMTWPIEKEAEMAFTFRVMSMITCIITHFRLNTSCRWRKKTMMEPFLCYKVHREVSYNFVEMMHNTAQLQETAGNRAYHIPGIFAFDPQLTFSVFLQIILSLFITAVY